MLPGCARLSIRYAQAASGDTGGLVWSDAPDAGALALPGLVELTLELESGDRFTRVCAIPAGTVTRASEPST